MYDVICQLNHNKTGMGGRGEEISVLGSADLKMEEPAMRGSVPGFLTHVVHEGDFSSSLQLRVREDGLPLLRPGQG